VIKGIIFDCFGVLISNDLKTRIDAAVKVNPSIAEDLNGLQRALDRGILERHEWASQAGMLMRVDPDELLSGIRNSLVMNTELMAFIATLRPQYKVGMLSNVRGRDRLEELFDNGELDELFDTVVASGDVGLIKPEPEVYELTAERLGVDPKDCVMIDDLEPYCAGAEAVGMRSILFTDTEQFKKDFANLIDTETQTN
jgi:epoxide hydrolase-like predicted phosphatase